MRGVAAATDRIGSREAIEREAIREATEEAFREAAEEATCEAAEEAIREAAEEATCEAESAERPGGSLGLKPFLIEKASSWGVN